MIEKTRSLINQVINEDIESFQEAMNILISEHVKLRLEDIETHVANNLLTMNEVRGLVNKTFSFRNSGDSGKFTKAALNAGVEKNHIQKRGNNITLNNVDNELMEMMFQLAKDMKGKINESLNVIYAIQGNEEGVDLVYMTEDEEQIYLSLEDQEKIMELHDTLNSENQELMRNKLIESRDSAAKLLDFINTD